MDEGSLEGEVQGAVMGPGSIHPDGSVTKDQEPQLLCPRIGRESRALCALYESVCCVVRGTQYGERHESHAWCQGII